MAEINKLSVGQAIDKLHGRLSASMLVICRSQKRWRETFRVLVVSELAEGFHSSFDGRFSFFNLIFFGVFFRRAFFAAFFDGNSFAGASFRNVSIGGVSLETALAKVRLAFATNASAFANRSLS